MCLLKQSLLLPTAFILGVHGSWAMEERENTRSTRTAYLKEDEKQEIDNHITSPFEIVERTYRDTKYTGGKFTYGENESSIYSLPRQPKKSYEQSVSVYEDNPQELSLETVVGKVIPGKDGRLRISKTHEWPYSIHVKLTMTLDNIECGGSGTLIGPHHLLTAAHNVYNRKGPLSERMWVSDLIAYPALNETIAPFNKAYAAKIYIFKSWIESASKEYDMALILLDHSIGRYTGWSGLLSLKMDKELSEQTVSITGYPADKGRTQMWTMAHKILKIMPERLGYDIDTYKGQSGSAIWINQYGGSPYTVGVHTQGHYMGNFGVRLSEEKFKRFLIPYISNTYKIEQKKNSSSSPRILHLEDSDYHYSLGLKYAKGEGVPRDDSEAMKYFRLAAEQGHTCAQFNLARIYDLGGWMYYNEKSGLKDNKEAIKWLQVASDNGHCEAQFRLGDIYLLGYEDIPKDIDKSIKFFQLAAEQGHPHASNRLHHIYSGGNNNIPRDERKKSEWWAKYSDASKASWYLSLPY